MNKYMCRRWVKSFEMEITADNEEEAIIAFEAEEKAQEMPQSQGSHVSVDRITRAEESLSDEQYKGEGD